MTSVGEKEAIAIADADDRSPQTSAGTAALRDAPRASRFMLINVAALRAKQLRRGATPRVELIDRPETAEQLAMEEVKCGLIPYNPSSHHADEGAPQEEASGSDPD
jgi:DNA-directed RNA polymerase subunit K/omega